MMNLHDVSLRRLLPLALMAALAAVIAGACAPNPNAPTSLTGTWTGNVTSTAFGTFAVQLTLTQSGTSITGFLTNTIPGQTSSGSAALTGSLQGNSITLLIPTGTCLRTWTGTLAGTTMSGTLATSGTCANPDSGTFSVTLE